jgi:hypothetical protein
MFSGQLVTFNRISTDLSAAGARGRAEVRGLASGLGRLKVATHEAPTGIQLLLDLYLLYHGCHKNGATSPFEHQRIMLYE